MASSKIQFSKNRNKSDHSNGNRIASFFMGIGFMVIGGGLFYVQSYNDLVNSFKSKNWPFVIAVVNQNWINTQAGEDNDLYRLNFEVIYSVEGKEYNKVNRYLASESSTSWTSDYYEFVDDYPEGTTIKLFYNPEKPYEATIKPGFLPNFNFLLIFCCVFFFFGLLIFFRSLKSTISDYI